MWICAEFVAVHCKDGRQKPQAIIPYYEKRQGGQKPFHEFPIADIICYCETANDLLTTPYI